MVKSLDSLRGFHTFCTLSRTSLWARLDPRFFEIGWQRDTEPQVGQRDAKNFWNSLSKQTREKCKNLKCNNGVRHEKHDDGACLQNQKMLSCKYKGRTGRDRFLLLLCRPAALPLPDFTNLWVKFNALR